MLFVWTLFHKFLKDRRKKESNSKDTRCAWDTNRNKINHSQHCHTFNNDLFNLMKTHCANTILWIMIPEILKYSPLFCPLKDIIFFKSSMIINHSMIELSSVLLSKQRNDCHTQMQTKYCCSQGISLEFKNLMSFVRFLDLLHLHSFSMLKSSSNTWIQTI